jgi:hypothetical protein
MKKNILILFLLVLLSTSCIKLQIKKDLASRFTTFKIIEIKKDSANVIELHNFYLSLILNISDFKLNKSELDLKLAKNEITYNKYLKEYKDLQERLSSHFADFTEDLHLRSEPCYYVKYRYDNNRIQITSEEYYEYKESNKSLYHRPLDTKEYFELMRSTLIEMKPLTPDF